jgi:hypothetical protein
MCLGQITCIHQNDFPQKTALQLNFITERKPVSYLNTEFKSMKQELIVQMTGHVLKEMASCPVPGMTNEKHTNN